MARFIAAQRAEHQIPHATACRALQVSPSWFYKWRDDLLIETNNIVIPLQVETWKAIDEKWLAFNKTFKQ